jgi:hypothetical protein
MISLINVEGNLRVSYDSDLVSAQYGIHKLWCYVIIEIPTCADLHKAKEIAN